MDIITFSLLLLTFVLIWVTLRGKGTFNSIPGPFRVPLFGNLQFKFDQLHKQFAEFSTKYGDLYRIQILTQPAIVINSYDLFKEAYSVRGKDFIGRPDMLRFQVIGANHGIAFREYSDKQVDLRTRAIRTLALQGHQHLSDLINNNLDGLVRLFKQQNGETFDPRIPIKKFLISIIFTMVFGHEIGYDDPTLDGIIEFNNAAVEAATIGKEDVDVWTWTRKFNPNYALAKKARAAFERTVVPLYHKYKNTYVSGHVRGSIDQYIADVLAGNLTDDDVLGTLIDYFIGGVETTATTLYGFILTLLTSSKVQEKLQAEVDEVVGKDRCPNVTDKSSMPFTEACLLELLRYQNSVPILMPRMAVNDTELAGYKIPAGTWLYTNAWSIHHKEDLYPEPYSFKPERFLDESGNLVPQSDMRRKRLVSFGFGGRHCIGESLAKTRLFLSVSTLMQNFTFVQDEDHLPPDSDPIHYKLRIILDVPSYKLKAIPRS